MAPFTKISDEDRLQLTAHFWVLWAVAGPVTLLVLAVWDLWTQRAEVNATMNENLQKLEKTEIMTKLRSQKMEVGRAFRERLERLKGMEMWRKRNRSTPGDVEPTGAVAATAGYEDGKQES